MMMMMMKEETQWMGREGCTDVENIDVIDDRCFLGDNNDMMFVDVFVIRTVD